MAFAARCDQDHLNVAVALGNREDVTFPRDGAPDALRDLALELLHG